MIGIIFVNRKNTVDPYKVNVDKRRIRSIQKTIDDYSGKGEIKEEISTIPCFFDPFATKFEIISKKYIGKERCFNYCCGEFDSYDCYEYKYYSYKQHTLSRLCDELLESTDSIELSYSIRDILNYECENDIEQKFLKKIIKSFKFKKISDINFLIKIRNELKKITMQKDNFQSDVNFNDAVENRIYKMTPLYETFCGCAIDKGKAKMKILDALPIEEELKLK